MTGSSQHSRTGLCGVLHTRIAGGYACDLDAIVEAVLTGGHDRITRMQALVDQGAAIECLIDGDWADSRAIIWLHDEDIGTTLPVLHRAQRHSDAVMLLRHHKVDVDELAGPQRALRVGEGRLQLCGS